MKFIPFPSAARPPSMRPRMGLRTSAATNSSYSAEFFSATSASSVTVTYCAPVSQ